MKNQVRISFQAISKIDIEGIGILKVKKDLHHRPHGNIYTFRKDAYKYVQFNTPVFTEEEYRDGYNSAGEGIRLRVAEWSDYT